MKVNRLELSNTIINKIKSLHCSIKKVAAEEQKRYRAKRKASQITDPSDLKEIREESKLEEVKDQMQIESSTQKFNVILNTGPIFKKIKLSEMRFLQCQMLMMN